MNSNQHPSAYGYRPATWSALPHKPPVNEDTLKSGQLQIERKTFVFTLKENVRGRLLRITEDLGGRRNSIIVPSRHFEKFGYILIADVVFADTRNITILNEASETSKESPEPC